MTHQAEEPLQSVGSGCGHNGHAEFVKIQQDRFLRLFHEMNEKAQEAMSAGTDEPETALEYLKKVNDTLHKLESQPIPL